MMTRLRTAAVLALVLPLAAADSARIETDARSGANMPLPGMSGTSLFYVPDTQPDAFRLYGPDGHLAVARLLAGRSTATLVGLEVAPDGSIAVSWQDMRAHRGCGIDILNSDGETIRSIPTGLFEPRHLAFAPDGSLWMFGTEYTAKGYDGKSVDEFATLRHVSADGKLIGQFLPRSLFEHGLPPANFGNQQRTLFLGEDRIGLLAVNGQDSGKMQWVEVDFAGKVLGRYTLRPEERNTVMTADGRVVIQNWKDQKFSILDRASGEWKVAPIPSSRYQYLWGVDGNQLLFLSWKGGPLVIDRVAAPGSGEVAQK